VQLWREWRQGSQPRPPISQPAVAVGNESLDGGLVREAISARKFERVALILPTSLCSGQIATMIANRMNAESSSRFARAVALPHTEGCGNSGGESEKLFLRTMAGYLAHPLAGRALLLEHGCEKTHNDQFRRTLRELGLRESDFGFASIQMDGGIERVIAKVIAWFDTAEAVARPAPFSIGFAGMDLPENVGAAFELLAKGLAAAGSTTVFAGNISGTGDLVEYGQRFENSGSCIFRMEAPTDDLLEITTGLGATGVQMLAVFANAAHFPGNPLVPTLQLSSASASGADILISPRMRAEDIARRILECIRECGTGSRIPKSRASQNFAFQITRGFEGISL
jgi:altronate dehydratase